MDCDGAGISNRHPGQSRRYDYRNVFGTDRSRPDFRFDYRNRAGSNFNPGANSDISTKNGANARYGCRDGKLDDYRITGMVL